MAINIICALDRNRGIGYKDQLLCHLPNDLKRFKKLTDNSIVVMGRNTYNSILTQLGKPLPNRISLVLTRDRGYQANHEDVYEFNSINEVLYDYENHCTDDIWIIGGQQVYEQFLPYADNLYLTIINHEFENVDTYFPAISNEWKCVDKVENKKDDKHLYDYHYLTYTKKNKSKNFK